MKIQFHTFHRVANRYRLILVIFCAIFGLSKIYSQTLSVNPNPFSTRTLISYALASNDTISLSIVNVSGSVVITLYSNTPRPAGAYNDSLIMDNFPDGIYFVLLKLKKGNKTVKIIKSYGVDIKENTNDWAIICFPNPTSDKIHLQSVERFDRITLINSFGQILFEKIKPFVSEEFEMFNLPTGVYYLKVENQRGQKAFKIVRE